MRTPEEIKLRFKNGLIPDENDFGDLIDIVSNTAELNVPSQEGSSGLFLSTDGSATHWAEVNMDSKVDKVAGKQLSTNDYTTPEQQKLASLYQYTDEMAVSAVPPFQLTQTINNKPVSSNPILVASDVSAVSISGNQSVSGIKTLSTLKVNTANEPVAYNYLIDTQTNSVAKFNVLTDGRATINSSNTSATTSDLTVNNTASRINGYLLDLQVNGSTRFNVSARGTVAVSASSYGVLASSTSNTAAAIYADNTGNGTGIFGNSKGGYGVYGSSLNNSAGYFLATGSLSANNAQPVVYISRNQSPSGAFNTTGDLLKISDNSTTSNPSGYLISGYIGGIEYFHVNPRCTNTSNSSVLLGNSYTNITAAKLLTLAVTGDIRFSIDASGGINSPTITALQHDIDNKLPPMDGTGGMYLKSLGAGTYWTYIDHTINGKPISGNPILTAADVSANPIIGYTPANEIHTHEISAVNQLQETLDSKASTATLLNYLPTSGGTLTGNGTNLPVLTINDSLNVAKFKVLNDGNINIAGYEEVITNVGKYQVYLNNISTIPIFKIQTYHWNGSTFVNTYGVGVGENALYNNKGISSNAIGYNTLSSSTGNDCNAFGFEALNSNTGASCNAIGSYTLRNNTGANCNAIGAFALRNNTGANCNAVGTYALYHNDYSNCNAFGYYAMGSSTGSYNSAFGSATMYSNTGTNCNGIGNSTMYKNTGDYVIGIGDNTARNNGGDYNIAIGYVSSYHNASNYNIGIGSSSNYYGNWGNTISIGHNTVSSPLSFIQDPTTTKVFDNAAFIGSNLIRIVGHGFSSDSSKINLFVKVTSGTLPSGEIYNNNVNSFTIVDYDTLSIVYYGVPASGFLCELTNSIDNSNSISLGNNSYTFEKNQIVLGDSQIQTVFANQSGSATIIQGGVVMGTRTVNTDTTLLPSDYTLRVSNTANITLLADRIGRIFVIKNIGTDIIVTILGIVDGIQDMTLATRNESVTIQFNGTDWDII